MQLKSSYQLDDLIEIMKALRDPETGCPWDLKQTFSSVISHTLEEAYEVADAIEREDYDELKLELGDLLFQVIFYAQLGKEQEKFDMQDIISGICEKLIRRHPHVFADEILSTEAEIKANWETEKAKERESKSNANVRLSTLDNIPQSLPALSRAIKLQKRCAHVGFDWPNVSQALAKVKEEIAELEHELEQETIDASLVEAELGDLMFALTNINRHLKLDAETTMRKANSKFETRFRSLEQLAEAKQYDLNSLSLEAMEALWQEVKQNERNG
ncbi:nucleoside triphosphate pyrophosphohydrolase [Catenovulum maritimum]|uniref:Nucleoside triphosphate pyrophosphohydrolase n=1 Tax=Catenovulum maritimum TaxID=1513271 RepID=A0A0J8JND1_9ALTE|nr:nucleoside triphosphate pyrophosphohydrolase [Catenovulum maritimum]KMT66116.1 nucleoside triphosphate hydrolase [Catenovulum maritimum]